MHITIGAAFFVLLVIHRIQNSQRASLSSQTAAQVQQQEPAQGQQDNLFLPVVGGNGVGSDGSAVPTAQESRDSQQQTIEPTSIPEPTATVAVAPPDAEPTSELPDDTAIYNYGDETRGKVINLAGIDVQLPEDGYVEGVIVTVYPTHRPGEEPVKPPLVVVCRDSSCAAVEHATGRIFLGDPLDIVRQELEFLIQALGEDKIVPRFTEERSDVSE